MIRNIPQLKRIRLVFCDYGGSSQGIREAFKQKEIYNFVNSNKNLIFEFYIRRGHHPFFKAEYINGYTKEIGLRKFNHNEFLNALKEVSTQGIHKPNLVGRKPLKHNGYKVISNQTSIQGPWRYDLFSQDPEHSMQHFQPLERVEDGEEVKRQRGIIHKYKPQKEKHNSLLAMKKEKAELEV